MKQQLTEQERFDLMIYRLQRAHETMKEALVMSRESFYNAAVNRLYYACYQFEKRQSGDYDDFIYNDKETADELYPQAEAFIQAIEDLINHPK